MSKVDDKDIAKINDLVAKADNMKKQELADLSSDQDLSIAVMNLIGIEEHLVFSGNKTGKTKYYDLVKPIREMRTELMKRMIPKYEGEVWCTSKHLLAASYRLIEVGTKAQSMGKDQLAYDYFEKSFDLYSLFWGLNMDLIPEGQAREMAEEHVESIPDKTFVEKVLGSKNEKEDKSEKAEKKSPEGLVANSNSTFDAKPAKNKTFSALGAFVQKVIDCCKE
ncbi:MAG: hypothetical protein FWF01_03190 [Alphaproteobacteria bacterium]|nr:hypothetical protein [Alphaproteobacteria bacterium]